MTTTFENAKVGDRVYSLFHNEFFQIARISTTYKLPIVLRDGDTERYCGYDGSHGDGRQVYFWDKPEIIAPPKPKPEAPPVDTLIQFYNQFGEWENAYSAGYFMGDMGVIAIWAFGTTSKTSGGKVQGQLKWRIPQDNDGWIEWNGGECPVPSQTIIVAKFRNGVIIETKANRHNWYHAGVHEPTIHDSSCDIIAYKVMK